MNRFCPKILIAAAVLLSLLANQRIFAQDEKRHGISLGAGRQGLDTRDVLESPMTYSNQLDILQVSYQYNGQKDRHFLEISFSRGALEASTKNTMTLNQISGRYHYYHRITSLLSEKLDLFIGGVISHQSSEKQFNLASGFMKIGSFDEATSLNLSMLGEYRFAQNDKISLGIYSPFASYVLRPNYSLFPRDVISKYNTLFGFFIGEGRFRTVNDFQGLNMWVSIQKSLFTSFAASLGYSFTFYKIKYPAESAAVSNSFNINLVYLF